MNDYEDEAALYGWYDEQDATYGWDDAPELTDGQLVEMALREGVSCASIDELRSIYG